MIGNVPLLRKSLEHATEHPEEHMQGEWAIQLNCGTAGCIAYWIASFAGHEVDWRGSRLGLTGIFRSEMTTSGDHISNVARREAGLTQDQARRLFDGANSISRLWELAAEFTDGEISRERVV